MAFTLISKIIEWRHTGLNFNLFIANGVLEGFAVKSDSLLLVADCFYRAVIEFLESRWDNNFDGGHWRKLWLMNATEGGSKKTSLNFCALFVTDIVKCVVFQEIGVEYLLAVLLVNITAIVDIIWAYHSHPELVFAVYVIDGFQLCYKITFMSHKIQI